MGSIPIRGANKNYIMWNEKMKRRKVSVYACAYEIYNISLISDVEYDKLAYSVDLAKSTDRPDLDLWFSENYTPSTALWIHEHPELEKLKDLTRLIYLPTNFNRTINANRNST